VEEEPLFGTIPYIRYSRKWFRINVIVLHLGGKERLTTACRSSGTPGCAAGGHNCLRRQGFARWGSPHKYVLRRFAPPRCFMPSSRPCWKELTTASLASHSGLLVRPLPCSAIPLVATHLSQSVEVGSLGHFSDKLLLGSIISDVHGGWLGAIQFPCVIPQRQQLHPPAIGAFIRAGIMCWSPHPVIPCSSALILHDPVRPARHMIGKRYVEHGERAFAFAMIVAVFQECRAVQRRRFPACRAGP
jgi:hypothetical protein